MSHFKEYSNDRFVYETMFISDGQCDPSIYLTLRALLIKDVSNCRMQISKYASDFIAWEEYNAHMYPEKISKSN